MTQTETRDGLEILERDRRARAIYRALGDRIVPAPGGWPLDWEPARAADEEAQVAAAELELLSHAQATFRAAAPAAPPAPVAPPPITRDPRGKFTIPPAQTPPAERPPAPASVAEIDDMAAPRHSSVTLGVSILAALIWGAIVGAAIMARALTSLPR